MTPVDVRIEGVWKQYRLGTRRSSDAFWALSDLSLDVPRGQSVGVIGPNGAGKSTLMKLVAGITAPTRGRITIDGALSALIEVGSGFHPELTGRENIFLSGSILGMKRRDIARSIDAIVAFAGVERFVDTPVKWYSSGMYVRLGFAIAAHLQPDILLVDEVLAVGDAEFQAKCLTRIRELQRDGTTILFISHDLTAVEQLCDRAVLLDHGQKIAEGPPAEVVALYHHRIVSAQKSYAADDHPAYRRNLLRLTNLTFEGPGGAQGVVRAGGRVAIQVKYLVEQAMEPVRFDVTFHSQDGRTLLGTLETEPTRLPVGNGLVEFAVPALPLQPGAYHVGASARDARTRQVIDWWDGGSQLLVENPGDHRAGQFAIPYSWQVRPIDATAAVSAARDR